MRDYRYYSDGGRHRALGGSGALLVRLGLPVLVVLFTAAAVIAAKVSMSGDSKPTPPGSAAPASAAPSSPGTAPSPSATIRRASPFAGLDQILKGRSGQITAAVYDARSGQTWLYHPGVSQNTASIVKVQILGAFLTQARNAGTTPSAGDQLLMTTMIENSDNPAATMLLSKVGGPSGLGRFDRAAGLTATVPSTLTYIPGTQWPGWGLTKTTAADQVRLIRAFAYPNEVLAPPDRQYGLKLMENVEADQRWGISAGPGQGCVVALKNGWIELSGAGWQVNSVGWVSGNGRDYVLAVLTSGSQTEEYGISTVEAVSRAVYAALGS